MTDPGGGAPAARAIVRGRPSWWRVVLVSTRNAWADFADTFTPTTWILGWLGRIIAQVVFYALIGVMLDSPEQTTFLFVGAAVVAAAMESLLVVSTSTRERYSGTMPLLVASPARLWPVFLGRSVQWLPSGIATTTVVLFAVGPFFGVRFDLVEAAVAFAIVVVVAVGTYGYGLALASLVLRFMRLRNWATNLSYLLMMLICGVVVPVSFWPTWVQVLAHVFPITSALEGIRYVLDGSHGVAQALSLAAVSAGVGLLWTLLGAVSLELLASRGRRDGSIEYADG